MMSTNVYSVYSLVHYVKQTLDNDLHVQSILVKGEISNFTNHRSGHWYFTLKDKRAKINCVMFASYASRSKIMLKEGMNVIVSASLSMYEASGNIQLYVTKVQADGIGDLFLQLEQRKERLAKEGLFDPAHKKKLPSYPQRIGIVSAKTGAALQDMLITIQRRWPIAEIKLYPTLVQGEGAAADIIKTLKYADEQGHDVILLARGGGAIEDLWCFNDEMLARMIYQMKTVIVTGVGHETDITLADYVSDARAATPTAAAELITPDISDVLLQLHIMHKRLSKAMQYHLTKEKREFLRLRQHRYLRDPLSYIREEQMKLAINVQEIGVIERILQNKHKDVLQLSNAFIMLSRSYQQEHMTRLLHEKQKLLFALQQYENHAEKSMHNIITLLQAYSPLHILSRGYGLTYKEDHIVKSIQDIQENDEIRIRMHDGSLYANVKKKEMI